MAVIAEFIVAAVGTPEATGSAKVTVQLPHWVEVPLSVTLTLAIVAPASVGVGCGEPGVVGPEVSAGKEAWPAGVGTADVVTPAVEPAGAVDGVT
ncbi:MAG: hypothetical protein ACXWN4_08410 [Candidatus Limnocylindrales bacterium]